MAQKYEEDIEPSMCWIKAPKVSAVDTTVKNLNFEGTVEWQNISVRQSTGLFI